VRKDIYIKSLVIFCFLSPNILNAQANYFDSLNTTLSKLSEQQKIDTIIAIPFDKMNSNTIATLNLYKEALSITAHNKNHNIVAQLHEKIAIAYYYKGDYDLSVKSSLSAINHYEIINDSARVGSVYANMGYQMKRRDLPKAFEYMLKGVNILQHSNEKEALSAAYNNYGVLFEMSGKLDSALHFYNQSLIIVKEIKDSIGIAYSLNNIAGAFVLQGKFQEALPFYKNALRIRESRKDFNGMAENNTYYGDFYFKQNKYKQAIPFYVKAEKLSSQINYTYLQKVNCEQLALCYQKTKKFQQAFIYQQKAIDLKDNLLNEKTNNTIAQLEIQFESEKREKEIELLNKSNKLKDAEITVVEEEKKRKSTQLYFTFSIVFALVILAILIFRNNLQRKKNNQLLLQKNDEILQQKHIVEEQNNEILSSISYAKRIQTAILPTKKIVKEYLANSFILYKPKDIVAGDFYWMESVAPTSKNNNQLILFAAADCTGHGVPGAMVSVVCNNALNRSVREYGLTDPGKILDKTREIVIQEFEKSEEEVKDGMDIALCSLEGNKLKYAGAHNPLWIVRKGDILETKANKQPIGKFDNLESYTTHTFELQKDDTVYIFSDGYVDQFGGEKGKKFKAKSFRKLLLNVNEKTMEEQRDILDNVFEKWKGSIEQIDDVCVIGVKVNIDMKNILF